VKSVVFLAFLNTRAPFDREYLGGEAMVRTALATALLTSHLLMAHSAICQEQPKVEEPKENAIYQLPNELTEAIRAWNDKAEIFHKRDLYDEFFQENMKELSKGKPDGWVEKMKAVWDNLPAQLKPELPVSEPGALFLMSMYFENVEEFREYFRSGKWGRMYTKLYLILALAQQHAKELNSKEIQPSHLCVAISQVWAGAWPFFPAKSNR
jgi:hypothetical protein